MKKLVGNIWRKIPSALRKFVVRASQEKFTVSVAVIIVNESGEVLLLDHVLRPASGWGIPGGFMSGDEQPADAARRELFEEIGIELTDLELFRARTFSRHVEILFRAKAVGTPVVCSREINAFGWFAPGNLPENIGGSQRAIIEKLLTG